ncbi:glycosyltransferase family 2 protein [Flavobacterium sp. FlaQc-47]|uniref:glycosyltransferase family 2 protein n=1 Tax=Flavobacterium sp. FlaQc-47 TaxID=3374180 RepID=UPI003757AFF5
MKRYIIIIFDLLGIKLTVREYYRWAKFEYNQLINLFNITVIKQKIDYKSIPIIIISFNQLFYLKKLIDFLKSRNYKNIIIIDNNSTYQPLIQYFNEIDTSLTIHRLKVNYGHLVFWQVKELFEKYSKGYYVITDADINPLEECPEDFLLYFKKILDQNRKITKVGFSLKIDDIPETNINREKIIKWESKFWKDKDNDGNFIADLDTTFALYRPKYDLQEHGFYTARRTKNPYVAKHGGWYINNRNLTEEQKFYFQHCNESSSWRIDENGNVNKKIYLK